MNIVSAVLLLVIALAHSALGELDLLIPLFKKEWELKTMPRWAAEIIFRFAWHLTSLAWVTMAGILLGLEPYPLIALQSFIAGVVIFIVLRGHLAWPLFFAASISAYAAYQPLPSIAIALGLYLSSAGLLLVAFVHIYWAFGGKKGLGKVIPTADGQPLFQPSKWITLGVATFFMSMSMVLFYHAFQPSLVSTYAIAFVGAIMILRAVGDFRYAGFLKSVRDSSFAKYDDLFFTPFVTFVALSTSFAFAVS